MAAIALSKIPLAALKKDLRVYFGEICSSHLSEALAAAVGRRTHASLLAELAGFQSDPPIVLLDDDLFCRRITEFGYVGDEDFTFEYFRDAGLISTICPRGYDIVYTDDRGKAWRNLIVCAVNAEIEQKHFSLRPDDDRWPGDAREGFTYDFTLPGDLPARAYVRNIGQGELAIHAAVKPTGRSLSSYNAGFSAGEVFATGWLERKNGAWLQTTSDLSCRRALLPVMANLEVEPLGYGDHGRVIP